MDDRLFWKLYQVTVWRFLIAAWCLAYHKRPTSHYGRAAFAKKAILKGLINPGPIFLKAQIYLEIGLQYI